MVSPTTWSIKDSVVEIKTLMGKFENVLFTHVYREGNIVADWIAKQAVLWERKMRWHDDLSRSVDLKNLINYERTYVMKAKIS